MKNVAMTCFFFKENSYIVICKIKKKNKKSKYIYI